MADPPADRDTDLEPDSEPTVGMPRWAKVSGIIALVVVVLVLILLLTGGPGRHGPSRHSGNFGGHTTSTTHAHPAPTR